jgi:hypothetical protein
MKNLFFVLNLVISTVGAALGIAILVSVISAPQKLVFVLLGVGLVALAAVCLCISRECCIFKRRPDRLAF